MKIPQEKVDKGLPHKLRGELPGILNWAIAGCLNWQKDGLGEPVKVKEATSDYRDEMDEFSQFFEERCVLANEMGVKIETIYVSVGKLYEDYLKWVQKNGVEKVTKKSFGTMMGERGFKSVQKRLEGKNQRVYEGIGGKSDSELHEF